MAPPFLPGRQETDMRTSRMTFIKDFNIRMRILPGKISFEGA